MSKLAVLLPKLAVFWGKSKILRIVEQFLEKRKTKKAPLSRRPFGTNFGYILGYYATRFLVGFFAV